MKRLALALLGLWLSGAAQAQTNFNMPPPAGVSIIGLQVVATCGVGALSTSTPAFMVMNQLGQLCTNASGGGGGGAITMASGAVASGAYSAGSYAAGALAAGAFAAGAGVDGWDLSVGATTATAATAGGTGTVQAKLRLMTTQLDNINTNIQGAAPCLNATAFNTNSYSNAGTNPMNCDLNGGLYVHPPANQTVAQATAASFNATVVGTGTFATQSALTPTEVHAGEIGSNQIKVQVAQTVTASSAYTSGNAIGGLMTIAGAARVSGSLGAAGTGGILSAMVMNSKSLQTTQVDVVFFDANPTGSTCTDKTAFSLATADFDKVVGYLTIPGTAANGAGWVAGTVGSLGIPTYYPITYDLASATSIYACAVTRGTPTWTATTDVSFKFNFLRN